MKRSLPLTALLAILSAGANAAPAYDQNVTPDVIFGSGNANGAFTVERNSFVELGLRGKLRHDASGAPQNQFNSNGDGTYSFSAGVAPTQAFPTAEWSFEWSINTDHDPLSPTGSVLSDLTYTLGLDHDPGLATDFFTFDPINMSYADHAIGTNATGNGGGSVAGDDAEYATFISNNNVAQNSWKPHWFFPSFDPTVDATYNIFLAAAGSGGEELGRTEIQILVGSGSTATVPVPAPLALFGLGLLALGFMRARRG